MQYLTTRNMASIATPKIHKVVGSPTDSAPWMQSSPSNAVADQYYSTSNSTGIITDSGPDAYMSDASKSQRSRNSTTDMCVEKNTEGKPPYSYATLIKYAIERSSENKLTLSQIYQWVIDHYPYYGSAGSGWKNSIRHNLSLNKSFVRVPRPVNEPGKGSYWTVDQFAVDTDQRTRTNVRGRSSRSSSDPSLHNNHRASNINNSTNNDPWSFGGGNIVHRNYRDGRSLSTDAGAASALRQTSQYGYCNNSHPYGGYERSNYNQPQYTYPNYHYGQQRMPAHEALLSARQHSSVTYSLPASATANHYSQSTPFTTNNNIYSSMNTNTQQPFYSHRQSCPDLTSISSATYSETNMLPNFNAAGTNQVGLDSSSASPFGENKIIYTTPPSNSFTSPPNPYSTNNNEHHKFFASSSTSSPIKGNTRSANGAVNVPLSSFFKDFDGGKQQDPTTSSANNATPGLPSPVLSPSNCSSSSSQHLSAADPLAIVTQHPSPVTTTTLVASATTKTTTTAATPGNRLTSPYFSSAGLAINHIQQQQQRSSSSSSSSSVGECLTSPSSPLVMTDRNSPMSNNLEDSGGLRSPVPFCMDTTSAVAYIDMVSQQQQRQQKQQNAAIIADDNNSLSSLSSSQHDVCSPQPYIPGSAATNDSYQKEKYSQMVSNNTTAAASSTNSFLSQNSNEERFGYNSL